MSSHARWLILIVVLTIFCMWVATPPEFKGVQTEACANATAEERADLKCTENIELDFNGDGELDFSLHITQSLGLDLVGGLRVLLAADIPAANFTVEELAETANNVSRRVNALGLTEATIQVQGRDRILVELPGVRDPEQAVATIQQTALLEFVDFGGLSQQVRSYEGVKIVTTEQVELHRDSTETDEDPFADRQAHPVTGLPFETVMTGAGLQAASAVLSQTQGSSSAQWLINFEIKPEYQEVFGNFTGSRIGEPMAIVLDGEVLSAPTIQARLTDGGVISGQFTEDDANTLALQLRSGALPIPLRVESTQEVGATLGQESVRLSIQAGVIGVIVVLAFMLIYYRLPGLAADFALIVFIFLNIAVFKLLPVTLTLPAITGFLISIGTAVDGNILIFERIKEELRDGLPLDEALKAGFDRAWTSIRDSNLSTIIICGILFMFGQTPGASIVAGFAVTLAIGLILNLFTAVIVTRTFLYIIVGLLHNVIENNRSLLGA